MTTTRTVKARDILAGDTLIYRSRLRTVLNTALDLDDDDTVWVYVVLEAELDQPHNAWLLADEDAAILR